MANQENYVAKIMGALKDVFENEDSEFYIDVKQIDKENDGNDLVYAFGCVVPAEIYKQLTKKPVDALQFNHIANVLCFQNMRIIADKKQDEDAEKLLRQEQS